MFSPSNLKLFNIKSSTCPGYEYGTSREAAVNLTSSKGHSPCSCCVCVFVAVVGGGVVFNARVVPVGLRKFREDIST